MSKKNIAVFLDRDGVVNDVIDRGENFFAQGRRIRWTAPFKRDELHIKDGVQKALEDIKAFGFLLILVTNQPDIAYGLMAKKDSDEIMEEIKKLSLDDIFICYHGRDDNCSCKKPKPGMLLAAQKKWNIDMSASYMIGDTLDDMTAGLLAGCRTILINSCYNHNIETDFRVNNLFEAVKVIQILTKIGRS